MTNAPERIWAWKDLFGEGRVWSPEGGPLPETDGAWGGNEYVRAEALEAAQARIAELEARLEIDHYFVVDGDDIENMKRVETTPDERRTFPDKITCLEAEIDLISEAFATARAEALEEAAKVCDETASEAMVLFDDKHGMEVSLRSAAAIRALKGGSNG